MRGVTVLVFASICLTAASPAAQPPPSANPSAIRPSTSSERPERVDGRNPQSAMTGVDRLRAFDPAVVERGRAVFGEKCSSCHRANARGGQGFSGPDLIRSVLVLQDANGREIGAHLQAGHPDKSKPPIPLTPPELSDIATFLHREITFAAERTNYQLQYVMTGDAKAGEAYFNGAGGCTRCHAADGNLKGIGSRYDGPLLQALVAFGTIGGGGRGRGGTGAPPRTARRATVTLASGDTFSGVLLRLSDFDVTIRDDTGKQQSWLRTGNMPKVQVIDPLQGHIDLLPKYSDADIHNLAAYLATLK
jgi:mono/diheme cytochrome c family protein